VGLQDKKKTATLGENLLAGGGGKKFGVRCSSEICPGGEKKQNSRQPDEEVTKQFTKQRNLPILNLWARGETKFYLRFQGKGKKCGGGVKVRLPRTETKAKKLESCLSQTNKTFPVRWLDGKIGKTIQGPGVVQTNKGKMTAKNEGKISTKSKEKQQKKGSRVK